MSTPKSHARRSVPYPAMMQEQLRAQCADKIPTALLFPGSDGSYMRRTRTDGQSGDGSPVPSEEPACLEYRRTSYATPPHRWRRKPERT